VAHGRIVYDSTDSEEKPTRGYIAKLFVEYGGGGLGGNDNFFRPVAELQGFHSLSRTGNHVLHWRGRMGGVFENSSKEVPIFDRFFLGGMDSIRGYSYDDLSPRDPVTGDQIGGDRIGFVNLEYIWTFYPDLGLALVPFYDVGYQVDSRRKEMFSDIKQSVGLELRWRSPMGDLRFAYGYPLSKNVAGKRRNAGRFEFSMGQFF
jgi:outer membrane protein insertion porin family